MARQPKLYSPFTLTMRGKRKCFKRASHVALPLDRARQYFQSRLLSGMSGGMGLPKIPVVYELRAVKEDTSCA